MSPANATLPIRRPGEGRAPVRLAMFKSLGPGFRRDDGEGIWRARARLGYFAKESSM